jgi:hypothetical protein
VEIERKKEKRAWITDLSRTAIEIELQFIHIPLYNAGYVKISRYLIRRGKFSGIDPDVILRALSV